MLLLVKLLFKAAHAATASRSPPNQGATWLSASAGPSAPDAVMQLVQLLLLFCRKCRKCSQLLASCALPMCCHTVLLPRMLHCCNSFEAVGLLLLLLLLHLLLLPLLLLLVLLLLLLLLPELECPGISFLPRRKSSLLRLYSPCACVAGWSNRIPEVDDGVFITIGKDLLDLMKQTVQGKGVAVQYKTGQEMRLTKERKTALASHVEALQSYGCEADHCHSQD
jgi:hypothetical protein